MAQDELRGEASSSDNHVHAVLDSTGRLSELRLEPELLRRGRDGTVLDSTTLASRIRDTINMAYDDLVAKLAEKQNKEMAELADELTETTAGVSRSLGDLSLDIHQSMRDLGLDLPPPPSFR